MSPDGTSHEQTIRLHQKTKIWADHVRSGHIRKINAWFYFLTNVKTPIEYPLAATSVTAIQFHYIESTAICSNLQESGLTSNTQRDIFSGPSSLLELKNESLYGKKGSKQTLDLMNLGKSNCITGQHLRDSIEAHKIDIGCSGSPSKK